MFKSHPKGLVAAALSNMGERFGYYIMNAVLTLFICSKFGLSDHVAGIIYACDQIIDLFANGIHHVHVYTMNKPDVAEAIQTHLSGMLGRTF